MAGRQRRGRQRTMKSAQRLALATVFATFVLVGVGVLVRATNSGLGCPDWPTCHGGVVPPGDKYAIIEFSHRFVASIVGLLVIAVAYLAWKHYREVRPVVVVALLTVPLVGIQGLLGALAVVRELPPEVVATHLVTAMLILGCQVFVAIGMVRADPAGSAATLVEARDQRQRMGRIAVIALAWLVVLFWVGAYMAESGAATACADWPTCNGASIVPGDDHEWTHMGHRFLAGAFLVPLVLFVRAGVAARAFAWAQPIVRGVMVLYALQVGVGALNVWYTFPDPLTISHTVIATAIWILLASSAVLCYYTPVAVQERRAMRGAGVPA